MKKLLVLSIVVLVSFAILFAESESEPNNYSGQANTIPNAGASVVGVHGNIVNTDRDWWMYQAHGGDQINVTRTMGVMVGVYCPNSASYLGGADLLYIVPGTLGILYNNYVRISLPSGQTTGNVDYSVQITNNTNNTLPVELSTFNCNVTYQNFVSINWTTQSESNLQGYNIYRAETHHLENALMINPNIIPAENTSTVKDYTYSDEAAESQQSYYYWLESVELNNTNMYHGPISITVILGEDSDDNTPDLFSVNTAIVNNFPNPFNPSTSIMYYLAEDASSVDMEVYNVKGQKMADYYEGPQIEGYHSIVWNGKDLNGKTAASGLYMFKLNVDGKTFVKQGVLVK
ncbi:MAG: T9SS type A sorting domain-containing protein [Candidatus Cloacimonetes bacterium]|nr:T9SS type A sorting domain-containing protein [Candidatus Cloacimonadota bacterium]